MPRFLQIRTSKFPVLKGEADELVNPGTYGKAFARYLQQSLNDQGYDTPLVCCEDWGWWVEVRLPSKRIGLCCYRHHDENTECEFACSPSPEQDRVWSWPRLRFIDLGQELSKLIDDLKQTFRDDPEIEFLGEHDEFPFATSSLFDSGA